MGNYGTDLALRKEINRFLVTEDPYGWREFVNFGMQRGDLRSDLDVDMMGSILEWTMDRFQDALLTEELDPGLFRKTGPVPEKKKPASNSFSIFSGGRSDRRAPRSVRRQGRRRADVKARISQGTTGGATRGATGQPRGDRR